MTVHCYNDSSANIDLLKSRQPFVYLIFQSILVLLALVVLLPQGACAECKELKIVEYEDRVEAVCVGEPLTEAQKKAYLEEERRQDAAAQRQRMEEGKRQKDIDAANKSQAAVKPADESKKRTTQPVVPQKPVNKNTINPNKF